MPISIAIESGHRQTRPARVYGLSYGTTEVTPRQLNQPILFSGARRNPPLLLKRELDASFTAQFGSVLGQVLPTVNLNFYRVDPSGSGEMQVFYVITLSSAIISRAAWMVLPVHERTRFVERQVEEIEIAYRGFDSSVPAYVATTSDDWSQD